jgi:hypothetical protein
MQAAGRYTQLLPAGVDFERNGDVTPTSDGKDSQLLTVRADFYCDVYLHGLSVADCRPKSPVAHRFQCRFVLLRIA